MDKNLNTEKLLLDINKVIEKFPAIMHAVIDEKIDNKFTISVRMKKPDKSNGEWDDAMYIKIIKDEFRRLIVDQMVAAFNMKLRNHSDEYIFDGDFLERIDDAIDKLGDLNPDNKADKCIIMSVKSEYLLYENALYTVIQNGIISDNFQLGGIYKGVKIFIDRINSIMPDCPMFACYDDAAIYYEDKDIEVEETILDDCIKYDAVFNMQLIIKDKDKYVMFK